MLEMGDQRNILIWIVIRFWFNKRSLVLVAEGLEGALVAQDYYNKDYYN